MAGQTRITRAALKRQPLFGGAGDLYHSVIIFLGVMMAAAMLSALARPYGFHVFVAIMGTGLLLYVVRLARLARRNIRRMKNVLARGVVVQGRVEDITEMRMRSAGIFTMSLGWDIHYSYRDQGGNSHWGASGRVPRTEAKRYRIGDACEIAFDPEEPEASFWVHEVTKAPAGLGPGSRAA